MDAIERRKSIRNYIKKPLETDVFEIGIDSLGITGELKIDAPKISNPNEYIYITTWHKDSI